MLLHFFVAVDCLNCDPNNHLDHMDHSSDNYQLIGHHQRFGRFPKAGRVGDHDLLQDVAIFLQAV